MLRVTYEQEGFRSMIRNARLSLNFRVFALVLVVAGVLAHMGLFAGSFQAWKLMYYTIQSNILAALLFMILVWSDINVLWGRNHELRSVPLARFEMVCVVDLLLTFAVYWALLAPGSGAALWQIDNLAVHFLTPLLCLIDFLVFAERRASRPRDVSFALIFPLSYVLYSSLAGFAGYTYGVSAVDGRPKHFPYFFIDYERIGASACLYIGLVAVMLGAIGFAVRWLDGRIRRDS
jgi:hypothetical protein